jgi:hypothetical protein
MARSEEFDAVGTWSGADERAAGERGDVFAGGGAAADELL